MKKILWRRSTNLLSKIIPHYVFHQEEKVGRCPILSFMIESNCPESYDEFLNSYFLNLRWHLLVIFLESLFLNHNCETSNLPIFLNTNLVFLLPTCATNSLVKWIAFQTSICHVCDHYLIKLCMGNLILKGIVNLFSCES